MTVLNPVRFPDLRSREAMTRRAWWLVGLNLLIPGSVQVLAGNRKLGRWGIISTLALVILGVATLVLALVARSTLLALFTNVVVLTFVQVALVYFVVLWIVLTADTLRLVRIVRAAPVARPFIALLTVVALIAVAGVAGYGAVIVGSTRSVLVNVFGGGEMAAPVDGKYNIMLLGGDAGSSRVGLRPDSISVISIDAETGATTSIGIPRNLQRAPFVKGSPLDGPYPSGSYDCGVNCLISYLYTYGEAHPELYPDAAAHGSDPGTEAMRDAVEGVTGLTIQYFVLIDMGGFKDLVNALGGIDIDVKERLPIGGEANASGQVIGVTGWIEAGQQHMNGRTALWYARSRQSTSDYDRMRRQREVQAAIVSQFSPSNILTKFQSVAKAGTRIIKTDIPQGMLPGFVDIATKARSQKMVDVELVPKSGVNVIRPDIPAIHTMIDTALDQAVADAKAKASK